MVKLIISRPQLTVGCATITEIFTLWGCTKQSAICGLGLLLAISSEGEQWKMLALDYFENYSNLSFM